MNFSENNEKFEDFEEKINEDNIENSTSETFSYGIKRRRENNRKIIIPIALAASVIYVIAVVVGFVFLSDISGCGGNDTEIFINISEGSTLKEIAATLREENVISHETVFYLYARNRATDFKAGVHVFILLCLMKKYVTLCAKYQKKIP